MTCDIWLNISLFINLFEHNLQVVLYLSGHQETIAEPKCFIQFLTFLGQFGQIEASEAP